MKPEPTGIEALVCNDIALRQLRGLAKYGASVHSNPLSVVEWIQHSYEEKLDDAVYMRKVGLELAALFEPLPASELDRVLATPDLYELRWAEPHGLDAVSWVTTVVSVRLSDLVASLTAEPRNAGRPTVSVVLDFMVVHWAQLFRSLNTHQPNAIRSTNTGA